VPDAKEINTMIANKLAIASTPEQRLRINTAWPTCLCNKYFASLLPDLFNHISLHPPKSNPSDPEEIQQQRWLAVIKTYQSVSLAAEQLPNGANLVSHCRRKTTFYPSNNFEQRPRSGFLRLSFAIGTPRPSRRVQRRRRRTLICWMMRAPAQPSHVRGRDTSLFCFLIR
jgi:hypothetical protein